MWRAKLCMRRGCTRPIHRTDSFLSWRSIGQDGLGSGHSVLLHQVVAGWIGFGTFCATTPSICLPFVCPLSFSRPLSRGARCQPLPVRTWWSARWCRFLTTACASPQTSPCSSSCTTSCKRTSRKTKPPPQVRGQCNREVGTLAIAIAATGARLVNRLRKRQFPKESNRKSCLTVVVIVFVLLLLLLLLLLFFFVAAVVVVVFVLVVIDPAVVVDVLAATSAVAVAVFILVIAFRRCCRRRYCCCCCCFCFYCWSCRRRWYYRCRSRGTRLPPEERDAPAAHARRLPRRRRRQVPQSGGQAHAPIPQQGLETRAARALPVVGGKKHGPGEHRLGAAEARLHARAPHHPQVGAARRHGSHGRLFVFVGWPAFGRNAGKLDLLRGPVAKRLHTTRWQVGWRSVEVLPLVLRNFPLFLASSFTPMFGIPYGKHTLFNLNHNASFSVFLFLFCVFFSVCSLVRSVLFVCLLVPPVLNRAGKKLSWPPLDFNS